METILIQLEEEYDNETTIRRYSNYHSYTMLTLQSPKINLITICRKMKRIVEQVLNVATQSATRKNKQEYIKLDNKTATRLLLTLFQFKNAVKFFNKLGMILTTTKTKTKTMATTATATTMAFELPVDLDIKLYMKGIEALDSYIKRNAFSIPSQYMYRNKYIYYSTSISKAYFDVVDEFLRVFKFKISVSDPANNTSTKHINNYYKCLHTSNSISKLTSMIKNLYKKLITTQQDIGVINVSDYESILSNTDVIEFLRQVEFIVRSDSCLRYNVR